jgi:dTDP-4-dehydrorhamnose 3,5-epimerase
VAQTSDLFIQGVTFEPKPIFADARGDVRQFVTAGANGRIGEVYFSTVWPGVIKGYHLHKRMTLRYTCVVGVVLIGLADARPASPTFGRTMVWRLAEGGESYGVLTIPPGIWNAFRISGCMIRIAKGWRGGYALVCNAASHRHTKNEILRATVADIGTEILGPDFNLSG